MKQKTVELTMVAIAVFVLVVAVHQRIEAFSNVSISEDAGGRGGQSRCTLVVKAPSEAGATYTWLIAKAGGERDGGRIALSRGQSVTCDLLGIDPNELATARWLYIVRQAPGEATEYTRAYQMGFVCNADINGDGVVNVEELGQLKTQFFWRCDLYPCSADFSGDGVVNSIDVGMLKGVYGQKCGESII